MSRATPRSFGDQLRILRKSARLSQRDLGIATHYSEGQIYRFEGGAKPPDLSTLVAMFVPALGLDNSPEVISALLERAAAARGESMLGRVVQGGERIAPSIGVQHATLPGAHSGLLGRSDDAARLRALLTRDNVRLVTVLGPPGVGKTSLAVAVAHDLSGQFDAGAVFVPLAGISRADAVPDAVAQALGLQPAPGESARAALPGMLRAKKLLLVLDNLEQVAEIAVWLGELTDRAPALTLLATSRMPLRVRGEQQFALSPLVLPGLAPLPALDALARVPSVTLFVQCAQAVLPEFRLTEHNALAVAALCHRLDGLPLAIEMAAARTRLFAPQALLKRLADAQRDPLRWLEGGRAGAHARHASLQQAVQWSIDLLSDEDRRAFAGLGVFADGFDDAAALSVAGCSPEQLQRLADVSLLHPYNELAGVAALTGEDSEPRFRLLETLRAVAQVMLAQRGALEHQQSALLSWAMTLAEAAEPQLTQGDQSAWIARLDAERVNFLSALHSAASAEGGEMALRGLRLANALWRYWMFKGAHAEGQRWLERNLQALPVSDKSLEAERARARAYFGIGAMRYRQGDTGGGMAAARESERRWLLLGDEAGLATTLNLMGVIQADTAEYAEAEASHQRVLALRRAMGDRWGEAISLSNLGVVARHQGAYARAEQYYRAAIGMRREMRDDLALALVLSNLGDVLHFQGGYAEAMGLYLESLHLRRVRDDRHGVAMVLTNIGVLRLFAGELDAAERDLFESLQLTREVGDRHSESNAELDLGLLAIVRDQRGAALHHFEQALVLAEAVGNPAQVALVQANMVDAFLLSGQSARALQAGCASLEYYHAAKHTAGCVDALEALTLCAAAAGDCASATRWAHAAAASRAAIGVPRNPLIRASLARWLAQCPPAPGAPLAFEEALQQALAWN